MTDIPEPPETTAPTTKRSRGRLAVVLAVVAVVVLVVGFFVGRALWWSLRPTPEFGSLAAEPDSALRGTVAFLRPYPDNDCVWVVAASGANPRKVACVEGDAGALTWLPDGRIQATRYEGGEGTSATASWIIDVNSGEVEEIPTEEIPPQPDISTPASGPNGEEVSTKSERGQLTVTMTTDGNERTLLSVAAPDTYTFGAPVWGPDGTYFVVKDDLDRLLVITTNDPSETRVLVDGGYGPAITVTDITTNKG